MTRISMDAPRHFVDAHRVAKRFPRIPQVTYSGVDEAAYVLPAGHSILAATLKSREGDIGGRKGYTIYADGKRVSHVNTQRRLRMTAILQIRPAFYFRKP
jgi:hypothetical protein